MSLTPDVYYKGDSTCVCCGKPMGVNDVGITYHGKIAGHDLLFCVDCVSPLLSSVSKDMVRISPEIAFNERGELVTAARMAIRLRNRADGLKTLAIKMEDWASAIDVPNQIYPNQK